MPEKTYGEHGTEMHEKHGVGLTEAVHAKVYARAYDEGHAYGYTEVEEHYIELADFVRDLLRLI